MFALIFLKKKRKNNSCNDNFIGENTLLDRLIAIGDVSGLVEKSKNSANFLTVSRKFGFTCVYIFHTLQETTGKLFFHRQKFLIFFLTLYRLHL